MEYVKGTMVTVRNEGNATRRLSHSMNLQGAIMNAPTIMRGTAVATRGTAQSIGPRANEQKKRHDITSAERPVRPPSMIAALLSHATTTGLVPSIAPNIVPKPHTPILRPVVLAFSKPPGVG